MHPKREAKPDAKRPKLRTRTWTNWCGSVGNRAGGASEQATSEAVLRLAPVHPVGREELEDATMEVEQVLDQYALAITDGASASANLEAGCIEIDTVLTGASMGELHQKVALIVTQLDRYCDSMRIAPLGVAQPAHLPLTLQGSQTRLRTPDLGPLVPA